MRGKMKTQPIDELEQLRQRVAQLEEAETESKRVRKTLAEAKQCYTTIVEKANDGITIVKGGRLAFANERISEMAGYTIDGISTLSFEKVITAESLQVVLSRMQQRLAGEDVVSTYEIEFIHKDGRTIPCEISSSKIEWEGENAILVFIRDITERKQAEETIKIERDFSEHLISTAAVLIVGTNRQGEVTIFNKKCEEITGWKAEEIFGKKWFDVFVPERCKSQISEEFKWATKEERPYLKIDFPILTKDGEERTCSWSSTIVRDGEENLVLMLSVGIDITEQKQAEEELRKAAVILDTMIDGVTVSDMQGVITDINSATSKTYGYRKDEVIGKTPGEVLLAEEEHQKFSGYAERMLSGESIMGIECMSMDRNGKKFPISLSLSVIKDSEGNHTGIVAVHRDITAQKMAEEELQSAFRHLEEQNQKLAIPT